MRDFFNNFNFLEFIVHRKMSREGEKNDQSIHLLKLTCYLSIHREEEDKTNSHVLSRFHLEDKIVYASLPS